MMRARGAYRRQLSLLALALLLFAGSPVEPALAHDFGGGSGPGPGPPPPPPPCPCGGGGCGGCGGSGDPIDLATGEEMYYATDLRMSGYLPINIGRYYSSRSNYIGALGNGWSMSFNHRLRKLPDGTVLRRRDSGMTFQYVNAAGNYVTPVGERGTLVENPDGTFTFTEATGLVLDYDVRGRLDKVCNHRGHCLEMSYDPRGRLPIVGRSKFRPASATGDQVVALDYRLTRLDERRQDGSLTGRFVVFAYDDPSGRITTMSDQDSRTWSYSYDAIGNLIAITDPETNVMTCTYADPNDPQNLTAVSGGPADVAMTYDTSDRVVQEIVGDIEMNVTYTVPGVETSIQTLIRDGVGTVLRSETTQYEFNGTGNPTRIVTDNGDEVHYTRNAAGQVTLEEHFEDPGSGAALVESTAFTYDTAGVLLTKARTIAATGETITTTDTLQDGLVRSRERASSDDPTMVLRNEWDYTVGTGGVLWPEVTAHRVLSNPGGGTPAYDETTISYNADGQPELFTYPGGGVVAVTYTSGFSTGIGPMTSSFDSRGSVTSVTVNGVTSNYTYDDLERLATITSAEGTTTFTYTGLDLTRIDYPSHSIAYTYDAHHRLLTVVKNPDTTADVLMSVTYDPTAGQVTVARPAGTDTYNYNALRIFQHVENILTQNSLPSVMPTTRRGFMATSPDPVADFFLDIVLAE